MPEYCQQNLNSAHTLNGCDEDTIIEIASDQELFEIHSQPGGLLENASREEVISAAKRLSRDGDFRAVLRLEKGFLPFERSVLHEIVCYDS
jgi:hypothetical protein